MDSAVTCCAFNHLCNHDTSSRPTYNGSFLTSEVHLVKDKDNTLPGQFCHLSIGLAGNITWVGAYEQMPHVDIFVWRRVSLNALEKL